MRTTTDNSKRTDSAEHLHLSDLPRWTELLWIVLAALLALGLMYGIEEMLDARGRAIAASALVRGVPPPAALGTAG